MKPWSPSGTRPVKMPTNQAASTANQTAMPQSASQMKCGMTSSSRKKTVSRLRCRSSVTTRWIGWRRREAIARHGDGELLGHRCSFVTVSSCGAQAPVNLGGRFSRNAATPSAKSAVPIAPLLQLGLEGELLLERGGVRVLEELLRHGDRERRQRRPGRRRARPRAASKLSAGITSETRPQASASSAPSLRLELIHSNARANPSSRCRNHVPPESGTRPMPTKPGHERRGARGDAHVAGARERETRSGDRAVDGGDHRLGESADQPDVRMVGLLERLLERTCRSRRTPAGPVRRRSRDRRQ